jgi:hypothetical protein
VASFCRQLAALYPDMFCGFYLVKSYKFAKISATTKAREENKPRFGILINLEFFFEMCLTKFKNNKYYLIILATDIF